MEKDLYISLIYKNLKGEASSEERSQLDAFTAKSNESRMLREEIELTWELSQDDAFPSEIDVEADLLKVKNKLDFSPKRTTKVIPLWRRLSLAAGVMILVGFGFWAFNQFGGGGIETFESGGTVRHLALSDGTQVWLNKNSKLSVQSSFGKATREVELNGEAFFDVKRDEQSPFIILTDESVVTVLGTSFNVKENHVSTTVSVQSGKVRLEGDGKKVELEKGERGVHDYNNNEVGKTEAGSPNDLVWKTGRFIFKSQTLGSVVNQLEHHYDISIKMENPQIFDCEISAVMKADELGAVLEKVAAVVKADIEVVSESKFIFKNGECE